MPCPPNPNERAGDRQHRQEPNGDTDTLEACLACLLGARSAEAARKRRRSFENAVEATRLLSATESFEKLHRPRKRRAQATSPPPCFKVVGDSRTPGRFGREGTRAEPSERPRRRRSFGGRCPGR